MPGKRKTDRKSRFDFSKIKTTDIHCFAFPNEPKLTKDKLAEIFSLGGPTISSVPTEKEDFEASLSYQQFLFHFSSFFRCARNTESVITARNRKSRNLERYVTSLFDDVNLKTLCLDDGLFAISLEELRQYVNCDLRRITRIEPIIKRLLEASKSYQDLANEFENELEDAIASEKSIALKSVIAYRSGLEINPHDEEGAEAEFETFRQGKCALAWFGPIVPKIRNALLVRAIEKAHDNGIFFEIHTGLGDTDIVGPKCNPILLQDLLKDKRVRETKVVLIHGGYPYTVEASWLAKDFSNVSIEISTPYPPSFASTLNKERFITILQTVPMSRIVYGSDCFDLPELHWLSAKLTKEGLAQAFKDLASKEMLDEDHCHASAERILSSNADKLISR